eukprot:CAMPEP_0171800874 /NCGR_PEP_ID=MMETSP0991-20121206/71934_1 /TAXON_ID=483369 /ORGANISM="non described non described, Strain CCMP2098" /LENGTH=59 /DNA_ID=CAMNT_0012412457 /DNA_START=88 /DNA_END=264 /DNA_ORIENTATION=-
MLLAASNCWPNTPKGRSGREAAKEEEEGVVAAKLLRACMISNMAVVIDSVADAKSMDVP